VLPDATRIPIAEPMTLGRAPANTIQINNASVSRHHAQVGSDDDGRIYLEDAGSTYGTLLNGTPIRGRVAIEGEGLIGLGNVELRVERHRDDLEEGRTLVVPAGARLLVAPDRQSELQATETSFGMYPQIRPGWALKRLEALEGPQRYVLRHLERGDFLRMGADEVALFECLDGGSSLVELIVVAENLFGVEGSARLAQLLADLGAHGFLEGVETAEPPSVKRGWVARLARPREHTFNGASRFFDGLYRRGGFLVVTQPVLVVLGVAAVVGLVAFGVLLMRGHSSPFLVGKSVLLGSAIFVVGRLAIAVLHESAHGLVLTSYGRKVKRAGLKLILVFPYAFVETTEAWFEPRRHRLAVSAAGPVADLAVAGIFSIASIALPAGVGRQALFQLALAAYIGGLYNLNPLMDRDGYQILVHLLGQPGLRRRAREHLARRFSGALRDPSETRVVSVYAIAMFAWSFVTIAFVIFLSTRYYPKLKGFAPKEVVWAAFALFYLVILIPVLVVLARPLLSRRHLAARGAEADGI
jgi:putative peptide zinc metalloprotease protein